MRAFILMKFIIIIFLESQGNIHQYVNYSWKISCICKSCLRAKLLCFADYSLNIGFQNHPFKFKNIHSIFQEWFAMVSGSRPSSLAIQENNIALF